MILLFDVFGYRPCWCVHVELVFHCAPSDDWTSLGLSLYSFIILTGFVSIDPGLKRIIHFFVGSWLCVSRFLVTNDLHIQNTFTSTKSGSGAGC